MRMNWYYCSFLVLIACATPQWASSSVGTQAQKLTAEDSVICTATCTCTPVVIADAGTVDAGVIDAGFDAGIADAGIHVDAGTPNTDGGAWSLQVRGNQLLLPNGDLAKLRGANAFDVKMCSACTNNNWAEVRRKLDVAVTDWGMNFIRLNLEDASAEGVPYFNGLMQVVTGMRQRYPNVYLMVSIWSDSAALTATPNGNPNGGPNGQAHIDLTAKLTTLFRDEPNVLIGCSNEPRGRTNEVEYSAMRSCVDTVRSFELPNQSHIVAVQGLQNWGRNLEYYVGKSLGPNVVYEGHWYNHATDIPTLFAPSASLPVVIGEMGPGSQMTLADVDAFVKYAEGHGVPWLGWAFTRSCPPDMFTSAVNRCSTGPLLPSAWGQYMKDRLVKPWGTQ